MGIIREIFGHDSKGENIYSYTITNESGMTIRVIELGAALQRLRRQTGMENMLM